MEHQVGDKVTIQQPINRTVGDVYFTNGMLNLVGIKYNIIKVNKFRKTYILDCYIDWEWAEEWIEDPFLKLIKEVTR